MKDTGVRMTHKRVRDFEAAAHRIGVHHLIIIDLTYH